MEHKSCPVFVDGEEYDRPLTLVDLESKKMARYDLANYEMQPPSSNLFSARAEIKKPDSPT